MKHFVRKLKAITVATMRASRAIVATAALPAYGFVGAALVAYGIYQLSVPAAWIFGGVYVLFDAWRLARSSNV